MTVETFLSYFALIIVLITFYVFMYMYIACVLVYIFPLIFRTVKGILSKKDSFLPALQELSTHTDSSYLLRPICITISRQYFHQLTVRGSETKAGGLGQVLYDLSSKTVLEAETVSYIAK